VKISTLRATQSEHILDAVARVVAAGYSVTFAPGEVTISKPGTEPYTIVRSCPRDAAAHALQPLIWELDASRSVREAIDSEVSAASSANISHLRYL
jgi:hypothetical protein